MYGLMRLVHPAIPGFRLPGDLAIIFSIVSFLFLLLFFHNTRICMQNH